MNLRDRQWEEKYRPKTIDEFIFQDKSQEVIIKKIINEGVIPNLLLSGIQGSGKTTLSRLFISECNINPHDVLTINASDENSIDVMRNKISGFISTIPEGNYKVVQLEESDFISQNAQGALRSMIEDYAGNARFILTCNYPHKIIPAIKSRCSQINFSAPDKKSLALRLVKILQSENIKFDPKLLKSYIDIGYPDFRHIIKNIQKNCIENELRKPVTIDRNDDYKFKLLGLIEQDNWEEARLLLCKNVTNDEWEVIYRFIYENLDKSPKFKTKEKRDEAIICVAEFLDKDSRIADREICAAAFLATLGQM